MLLSWGYYDTRKLRELIPGIHLRYVYKYRVRYKETEPTERERQVRDAIATLGEKEPDWLRSIPQPTIKRIKQERTQERKPKGGFRTPYNQIKGRDKIYISHY